MKYSILILHLVFSITFTLNSIAATSEAGAMPTDTGAGTGLRLVATAALVDGEPVHGTSAGGAGTAVEIDFAREISECNVTAYRLHPIAVWGKNFCNFFYHNPETEVTVQLHHLAGNILHIAKMCCNSEYSFKIMAKQNYDFQKAWFEERSEGALHTNRLEELKIPSIPKEDDELKHTDFMEMIDIFRRWNSLDKAHEWRVESFLREVNTTERKFQKYRTARKLDIRGPAKHFSIYNTWQYKRLRNNEIHMASLAPISFLEKSDEPRRREKELYLAGGSYYDDLDDRLTSASQLSTWVSDHPDSAGTKTYQAFIVTEYSTRHYLTRTQASQLISEISRGAFRPRCEPRVEKL